MKRLMCAAVVASVAIAPMQARASTLGAIVSGGVIGGLIGSVYASGASATVNSVGTGISSAAAAVPAAAASTMAVVAATSTPVLVGVAVGGVAAYFLYSMGH